MAQTDPTEWNQAEPPAADTADSGDDGDDEGGPRLHVTMEEKSAIAREAAVRLFELVGAGVPQVEVVVEDEQIIVRLHGLPATLQASSDTRILESIQFLLNKAVNKMALKRSRLSLDAEGFRRRRPENFDAVAAALARRVKELGKAIAIGPLGQTEVRIFSQQLEKVPGVAVQVVGPHDRRRLIVAPQGSLPADVPAETPESADGGREFHGERHRRRKR